MDKEAVRELLRQKKGGELSPEDNEFIDNLAVKDIVKIWEMVQMETDWQEEVYKMKKKKTETKQKEAEKKAKESGEVVSGVDKESTAEGRAELKKQIEKNSKQEEEEEQKKAAEEKKKEEEELKRATAQAEREAEEAAAAEIAAVEAEAEAAAAKEAEEMDELDDDDEAALLAEAEREAELALEAEIEAELEKVAAEEEARWAAEEAEREAEELELAAKAAELGGEEEADEEELDEEALAAIEAELEAEVEEEDAILQQLEEVEPEPETAVEEEVKEDEPAPIEDAKDDEEKVDSSAVQEALKKHHEEQAKRKIRDANGKFILPDNFMELGIDPRTELDLVDLPVDISEKLTFMGSYPLVHWQGEVDKLNHLRKFDKRQMVITNYCIFVAHMKDGFCARCLEITEITKVQVSSDGKILHFIVPKEFDLVVRVPVSDTPIIVNICQTIYKYKKKKELPVEYMSQKALLETTQLKKPKHFVPGEVKHVHTKEELFKRLVAMNNQDDALAYLNLRKDPRTGLTLTEVPKDVRHTFQSGPFKTDPLLHFFSQVTKVNHKLGNDKRFCLVTNAALYLTYLTGKLQRCLIIHKVTELFVGASSIAFVVPEEFDLYIKLPNANATRLLESVFKTIFKFKMQRDVTVSKLTPEAAANANQLALAKPDKWKAKFVPVLQRKDLVDYLRKSNIKPDVEDY